MSNQAGNRLEWQGTLPAGIELAQAHVELAHTRTQVREVALRRKPAEQEEWGQPERFHLGHFRATLDLDAPIRDSCEDTELAISITFTGEAPRPVAIRILGNNQNDGELELELWHPAGFPPDAPVPPKVARRLWRAEVERMSIPATLVPPPSEGPGPDEDDSQQHGCPPDGDEVVLQPKSSARETATRSHACSSRAPDTGGNGKAAAGSSSPVAVAARPAVAAQLAAAPRAAPPPSQPRPAPAPGGGGVAVMAPLAGPVLVDRRGGILELPAAAADDAGIFDERARAIERDRHIRLAFLEHDRDTNPALDQDKWDQQMEALNVLLGTRIRVYASCGKSGIWPEHGALGASLLAKAQKVSQSFRQIFDALINADPGVDLFDWAFEFFATGAVVTHHNDLDWQDKLIRHGAPNSTYFLRYPMLAIVCIESDVDADFWRQHLRTLVRCAHIFLESAAPLLDDPYPAGELDFNFFPDRCFPRSRRRALRAEYASGVGAGLPSALEFNALRCRFASLLGQAFASTTNSTAKTTVIPPAMAAVLKPLGVDT